MMTFTLFPNLKVKSNPYIQDFIDALNKKDNISVVNPAHKNPLLSILPKKHWGDTFIFNWFESIPDFKYGILQSVIAIIFLLIIKLSGRKIIWILHNKQPHVQRYGYLKRFMSNLIARYADLIVTHANDGIELIQKKYPHALGKVRFLHHPTKNRLVHATNEKTYDLLIWGAIAPYKGVIEFTDYLCRHPEEKMNVCIIGKCSSAILYEELIHKLPENVTLIHERASFEKLGEYINRSHFVLMPYFSRSILSSGILMDSLSFGAKIIGPHTGAFKDYAQEPLLNVFTFHEFSDIYSIVNKQKHTPISQENYQKFLNENNWDAFAQSLLHLLKLK